MYWNKYIIAHIANNIQLTIYAARYL